MNTALDWSFVFPARHDIEFKWRSIWIWTMAHLDRITYRTFWVKFDREWQGASTEKQTELLDRSIKWIKEKEGGNG